MKLLCLIGHLSFSGVGQTCDESEDDVGRHSSASHQMKTHPEHDVIDLTDSEVSNIQQPFEIQYKGDDLQFPTHVFTRIIPE